MSDIIKIGSVRGYVDKDGMAWLNAEDVARGFGFIHREVKNGKTYETVRWSTVNSYLKEFGFRQDVGEDSQLVGKDDFIPENMVYRLGFKASNEVAQGFQAKLADEILPAIRKTGSYSVKQAPALPDFTDPVIAARAWADAMEQKQLAESKVEELAPKADFYDAVADSETLFSMADTAKVLDMGIGRNKLFKFLRDKGVLQNDNMPYQRFVDAGYFKVVEGKYEVNENVVVSKTTYVKQKGIDYIRKLLSKE